MSVGLIAFLPSRGLALAKALELQLILEEVNKQPGSGPGSIPACALWSLEDVIGYLMPDDEEAKEAQS
jgi:hypothetical protein